MKVETFEQPILTEEQQRRKNFQEKVFAIACREYKARFLYSLKTKTVYDLITNNRYRYNSHDDIFVFHDEHGLKDEDVLRAQVNLDRDSNGNYIYCDLGIRGLELSELYDIVVDKPVLSRHVIDNLTKQDLDNIEAYCESIIAERERMKDKYNIGKTKE